jgi:hypothetical protein
MDSLIKPYNDRRASFGRHETFSLRYAWLTKGFQAFMKKKTIFSSDEATIELGVGKNMVNAIKYWLRVSSMLEENSDGLNASLTALNLVTVSESANFYRSFSRQQPNL